MSDHATNQKRSQKRSPDSNKKAKLASSSATGFEPTVESTNKNNGVNNKLDGLPIEILHNIYGFVGKGNYIGFGNVNKRIYQMYNTYSLPKTSHYCGYTSFQDIIQKFESEFDVYYHSYVDPDDYTDHSFYVFRIYLLPICVEISIGIILFNQKDLLCWAQREKNIHLTFNIYCIAAFYGRLDFLKEMFEGPNFDIWDEEHEWMQMINISNLCGEAARGGNLECLEYLNKEQKCELNEYVFSSAVCSSSLECLSYLHQHGCSWNESVTISAAMTGQLESLKFLHEHGCPWNSDAYIQVN